MRCAGQNCLCTLAHDTRLAPIDDSGAVLAHLPAERASTAQPPARLRGL